MLTHSQARNAAEALWGRGGTQSIPTKTPGAFYFSCSSHGGFIIDGTVHPNLPEAKAVYGSAVTVPSGRIVKFRPPNSRRTMSYRPPLQMLIDDYPIYYLEEDVDWCLAVIHLGIWPHRLSEAQRVHHEWLSPVPMAKRKLRADARENGDPDLITWANRDGYGTADGQFHSPLPPGYSASNPPWRSYYVAQP